MKNILLIGLFMSFLFINCSPSAQEKSKKESASKDSLAYDANAKAESSQMGDSIAHDVSLSTATPKEKKFIKTADLKFKVKNVLQATEKIEDVTTKYGGYLTYSNLENKNENIRTTELTKDSLLISKQIDVVNEIKLRVPNEKLDSFVRELNPLVVFLDYRVIKLDDVTHQFLSTQKKNARFQKYENRQLNNIDKKSSKLNETTNAEDNLFDRQNQADDQQIKALELADNVKYCNLNIQIYQKPVIVREVIANFDFITEKKQGFFSRAGESLMQGWTILEELILFLLKTWSFLLISLVTIFGIIFIVRFFNKRRVE
ncbi:MAG: DUF4349 domain-containing protein [Bacteroidetes bacterium]|nr:DUF4349 domain-containing protein [Bacteroidota bacterium]